MFPVKVAVNNAKIRRVTSLELGMGMGGEFQQDPPVENVCNFHNIFMNH